MSPAPTLEPLLLLLRAFWVRCGRQIRLWAKVVCQDDESNVTSTNRLHHILMSLSASNSRLGSARPGPALPGPRRRHHRRIPWRCMEVWAVRAAGRRTAAGRMIIALCRTRKASMTDSTTTSDAIFAASSIRVARAREISPFLDVSRSLRGRYVTSRRRRTALQRPRPSLDSSLLPSPRVQPIT